MLNEKIGKLINDQINAELYSAYLYLDFANRCEDFGLDGFANWYEIQAKEERDHAIIFRRYLIDHGYSIVFDAIAKPDKVIKTVKDILNAGLEHEKLVTSLIATIYGEAFAQKDFATMQFLDWFMKEQVEEEKNANDMITKYDLFGADSKGLYMLNQELLGRVYTPTAMLKGE